MWLSLIVLALVLGIAYYQALQGMFSAFLMMMLTICCAAFAFGTYEWVTTHWVSAFWKWNPDSMQPIALAALFGVPLLVLRLVFDKIIRRACLLPAWVDRLCGGAAGFVTGMLTAGTLAVCVQMMPVDWPFLGFAPVDVVRPDASGLAASGGSQPTGAENSLWLSPDRFTAGLVTILSDGVFSGPDSLLQTTPDLVQSVAWSGSVARSMARYAPPKAISVVNTAPVEYVFKMTPNDTSGGTPNYEPVKPGSGLAFLMVRVQLKAEARDTNRSHLFTLRQLCLVGETKNDGVVHQFHPIAIQQADETDPVNRHIRSIKRGGSFQSVVDTVYVPRGDDNQIEVVFEVPIGFQPSLIEYRRAARALVTAAAGRRPAPRGGTPVSGDTTASATPPGDSASSGPPGEPSGAPPSPAARPPSRGGRIRGATSSGSGSTFSDQLPMTLTSYRMLKGAEVSRGELVNGHLVGDVAKQQGGSNDPVTRFSVPSDKRLLQLHVNKLQARSGLGRAITRAITVAQNYTVQDTNGNRYKLVGKYAVADARGTKVVEVQYFSGPVGSIGGLGTFDRIDESKLGADDEFVLLFLVNPGVRIVKFSTGGDASRADDLTIENLIAPR